MSKELYLSFLHFFGNHNICQRVSSNSSDGRKFQQEGNQLFQGSIGMFSTFLAVWNSVLEQTKVNKFKP